MLQVETSAVRSVSAAREHDDMTELIHSAQAGNADSFARLVELHQKRVFRVAYSILRSWEDAEDAVQEIFVKVFQHLRGFEGKSSFATWVTRIAVNESLMLVRKRKYKTVSIDEPVQQGEHEVKFDIADLGLDPEQSANHGELRTILAKCLDELRPALRLVFVLRDMEGLSTEETAEVVGIRVPAVKTRLLRARLALRAKLQKRLSLSRSTRFGSVASLLPA